MLQIDKLSEDNLLDVLRELFPSVNSIKKETFKFKNKRMIVDYYFEFAGKRFAIEFDGPTHFTKTKTQIRDNNLKEYCKIYNITLIRIPYFIQIDDSVLGCLFGWDFCKQHNLLGKIISVYPHGFIDEGCVLPADFNSYGTKLFLEHYTFFIRGNNDSWSVMKSIYDNAILRDRDIFIGIAPSEEMQLFWQHYPT